MRPDEARLADTRAWLLRAHDDLRGAAIAWHDEPFRKTHDLTELGRQCVALAPTLESALRPTAPLSEYAWRYRYPGDPAEPTRAEVEEALAIARGALATLTGLLPPAARP